MQNPRYALVAYVRNPVGEFVEKLRRELHPALPHLSAHVTILPPRHLQGSEHSAREQLAEICSTVEPFEITLGDVETMVLAAKQRSLYELTDAISAKDRVRALEVLDAILTSGDGEEAAIGHLYMLAKTFRQMLVILERNVRDQRMLWAALWQGFRVPPFAADDIIKQARRYKSRRDLTRAIRLVARADLSLRSNPVSKRLVLEKLVMDLTTEAKVETAGWMQEQLPV